jgi:hypothetical protein
MTQKAHLFMAANEQSPVVYGSVITPARWQGRGRPPSKGCYFRLKDGQTFTLGLADLRAMEREPRWDLELEDA